MNNQDVQTVLNKIQSNAHISAGWDIVAMTTDAQDVIECEFKSVEHAMRIYQAISELYDDLSADAENSKF